MPSSDKMYSMEGAIGQFGGKIIGVNIDASFGQNGGGLTYKNDGKLVGIYIGNG